MTREMNSPYPPSAAGQYCLAVTTKGYIKKKQEEEENPFNLILIRFHTLPSLWREAGKASCLLSFSLFFSLKIPLQDLATTTTSMANAFFLSRHLFSNSSSSTSE